MKTITWLTGLAFAAGVGAAIARPDWSQSFITLAHAEATRLVPASSTGNRFVEEGVAEMKREADQTAQDYDGWDKRRGCWVDLARARAFERDTGRSMPQVNTCEPMRQADVQRKQLLPPAPVAPRGYDNDCECQVLDPPPVEKSSALSWPQYQYYDHEDYRYETPD